MNDISQFKAAKAWKEALGLLPVPLRDSAENRERYVLLNGATGNFCLDFVGDLDSSSQRAAAWSCDVGHYVTCVGDSISVSRWDRESSEEKFSSRSIVAHLHEFHRYLEKNAPDRSESIVTHVLGVYRRIRSVVHDEFDGLQSLRILLHLLASAAAGQDRLSNESELALWGLSSEMIAPSERVSAATWQPLYNDLSGIGRYAVLRPDFDLVIRHASGAVFQDAHLEANNSPTFWLPGLEMPAQIENSALPQETGAYFTPPALARTLAEEATLDVPAIEGRSLTIFDPACGSGELLKECLRLLKIKQYRGNVRVVGWDRSRAAVDMARFVLAWERRSWPFQQVEIDISEHDSVMESNWPTGVDILVMNPPFRSWQSMSPIEQEVVSAIVGASGKPNLAMAFARRGVSVLSDCGILAMIAPNSLLEGTSASSRDTREILADLLTPQLVARLGDQTIFARALVDAGIYVGKKKPAPTPPTGVLWADSRSTSLGRGLRGLRQWRGAEAEPIKGEGFSVYLHKEIATTAAPWIARGYDAWFLYKQFQKSNKMLRADDLFDIKQGIRLGSDVFIIPKHYYSSLSKSERRFFRPAVMNPSVVDGGLNHAYYAFYPYTDGLPSIDTETSLQELVPRYYKDYLLQAKVSLKSRKTLIRQKELEWWDLLWPRSWQKEFRPKIVSKYFGGSRSFAFDPSGEFVVVVGNGWLLRKGAMEQSAQAGEDQNQYMPTEEECYLATIAYLSSSLARELLEYLSVQISGGQLDLSSKYISELPIPNLAIMKPANLNRLIQAGQRITKGKVDQWSEVDELILSVIT